MIEIANLTRLYGAQKAVDDVSLTVNAGEIVVIVGTSGSGKTTLMRMINRLVEPSAGVIKIDGKDNREVSAHILRRGIGYAIQGHGLFPHRSIAENIATVPRLLGWDRARIAARVDELLSCFISIRRSIAIGCLMSFPAASNSGSGWRGLWPPIRRYC